MGADDRGIEDQPFEIGILEGGEDLAPVTFAGEPVEASPLGVPVAESWGQIAPGCTSLGDPEDGINKLPVILGNPADIRPV